MRAVRPAALRALHAERVHPAGATLVLVGDIDPEQAIDAAEQALGTLERWRQGRSTCRPRRRSSPARCCWSTGPASVQSSLRMALPAVPRTHPDHAALQLANLVFGGYFSSRWVENIREDKGYTYGPHSVIEHSVAGSSLLVVGRGGHRGDRRRRCWRRSTSSAGSPALPPGEDELEQARQYALGTLQLGMSTQAGLAGLASTYAGFGLRLDYLAEHAARLATATRDDVAAAAREVPRAVRRGHGGARRRRARSRTRWPRCSAVERMTVAAPLTHERRRPGRAPRSGAAAGPDDARPGRPSPATTRLARRGLAAGAGARRRPDDGASLVRGRRRGASLGC